ncbi:MAG TPA: FkbM family methyltransferase, partial [Clostridia bacterium]|nr:FkbM family methyltransferase [Clostridia bacterium]
MGVGALLEKCLDLKSKNGIFKMILKLPGLIENNICIRGGWETGLANLMLSMAGKGSTIIDIGANIGYHTLYLASSADNVRCIGFEPNPGIYEEFKRNIEINGFTNVLAYDFAVGDK